MQELTLHIDDHRTSILIGRNLFPQRDIKAEGKVIYLVDVNVYQHHKEKFEGLQYILIPSGEKYKCLAYVEELMRKLVDLEADRTSFLVGVGGGLVTDLVGFVASTFMRGVGFGFISTTLLGQVDASIGGKNGVNLDGFKNMIGVIRQPSFVWCDLTMIESLDQGELVSGFAEVIKYGAIRDRKLFDFLEENYSSVLDRKTELLERIVTDSAAIKIDIVESDVTELGDRKLLNFGHTLGHAIEKLTGILHGEAVAIGMVLAAELSVKLGYLGRDEADRLRGVIEASGLPVETDQSMEAIFETLLKDKKRSGIHLGMILLHSLGDAFVHKIELESLKKALYDLH